MTQRVKLEVWVNLDNTPGPFHTKESARNIVAASLNAHLAHYQPMVNCTSDVKVYDTQGRETHIIDASLVGRTGHWSCSCTAGGVDIDTLNAHEAQIRMLH